MPGAAIEVIAVEVMAADDSVAAYGSGGKTSGLSETLEFPAQKLEIDLKRDCICTAVAPVLVVLLR